METALKAGERIDDLQRDGLRIIQREGGFPLRHGRGAAGGFRGGEARRARLRHGHGDGVLPLLLSARAEGNDIRRLSRCSGMWRIWRKGSVALNGLQARIRVHHADCREAGRIIGCETVQPRRDQPAVYGARRGLVSLRKPARFQTIRIARLQIGWACARVLQNGGRLCAALPAPRFLALCDAMRGAKVEPKRVRFIVSRPESAPKLVLVEGKKRGRPERPLLPMLVTHTADGGFTEEMRRIYGEL